MYPFVKLNAKCKVNFSKPLPLQARFQAQQMAEKEEKMIAIMEHQREPVTVAVRRVATAAGESSVGQI